MLASRPNPALHAPLGAYMTDGDQLIQILESDHAGALGEDVCTGAFVEIRPRELAGPEPHWRRIHPAHDPA